LRGQEYRDEPWYEEVMIRGAYTSEVFMGHRHLPHFVIAIRHDDGDSGSYILRASIDTGTLDDQIQRLGVNPISDAFIINHDGVLQTPSTMFGGALEQIPLVVPAYSHEARIIESMAPDGEPLMLGYAYIAHSPFVLILVSRQQDINEGWASLRRDLLAFLAVSILLILGVVLWGTTTMIRRLAKSDRRRAALYHQAEYNNKMAAIGRLAAGVAHEINNPLAIINERGGLMKDLLLSPHHEPSKDKMLQQVGSILESVDRCAKITHRLLGFARHMDLHAEHIDLHQLIEQVYGFLERETRYREVEVTITSEEGLPQIDSDRGQLQQVFLNILNNALAAVDRGGRIDVRLASPNPGQVAVLVVDDGIGIPAKDLDHIFEPFYSTKGNEGTGLGLSITYGIVKKLGGTVEVQSEAGVGTTFTVTLPVEREGAS
jgi:signal transduction histidine kinase